MKYSYATTRDSQITVSFGLQDFIPQEIFDIHVHPYKAIHFPENEWPFLKGIDELGCQQHRLALQQYMPSKTIHGLYFGLPRKSAQRQVMNSWVANEVSQNGSDLSRSLMVVSANDDISEVALALQKPIWVGVKVYHCYADRPDTMNASITEYAPEWMWELLNDMSGVMMLHIVKDQGIEDSDNQQEIRRLCKTYPKVKLILAHVARSFNYRTARRGLSFLSDIENVVVDTSAICEVETYRAALKSLGPRRILWGSDYAVSEMRGRCVTIGNQFFWLHPELIQPDYQSPTGHEFTLVGIESLICLREAAEDFGLTGDDVQDIFLNNALRLLQPHLSVEDEKTDVSGPDQWLRAREVICGGTALLSKRAEMYEANSWPAYYNRSSGCEVWDLNDVKYIDFVGGVGTTMLGYADKEVNAAVHRRMAMGSYSSLVNPQEITLAEKLLSLHPWAGKVRYARTGGEAMAVAVRCARTATGKSGIAFCGYHGWHDWYLAANLGQSSALDGHLIPGLQPQGVPRELAGTSLPFTYNDISSFDRAIEQLGHNFAAVVMEPMRSQYPHPEFIAHITQKCKELNVILVVDEITSGLRYGYPGAHPSIDLQPDIVVYAKAMSNGYPFGVVIGKQEIMEASEASFISSSYWTDGIGTAAALAVLKKMEAEKVQETVWQKGKDLMNRLQELADRYPGCKIKVFGMPATPNIGFDCGENSQLCKSFYIGKMLEKGFLVSTFFYLMQAHKAKHIDSLLKALDDVFSELEDMIMTGEILKIETSTKNHGGFSRLT
ncbi:aminotransferase class III-fold pyridoxal phosphate-dependent enzyme [Membranihabitans marinus]|uniref:aminotransferase class III-fold pyridoxal phosphate-dependent enzyme n=1 Tax=Membranihabitans marinus TaxID=1227546 RepID=UPI001EFFB7D5|nr:aminotransferase class III-fold pyridoxal phosphate-dependent enzyme [Membranihabitans marinus]